MDGAPNPKTKKYKGSLVSETRFSVIKFLEKEVPLLHGEVLDIGAGNWPLPKSLVSPGVKYTSMDRKHYGNSKNTVDIIGSVETMPKDWDNKWDAVMMIEVMECIENPFLAADELYRVIKVGGTALITAPFNYRWFGDASWDRKPGISPVKDYWRITEDGWGLLMKKFSKVNIFGFGGSGKHDRFVYCVKAVK